MKDIRHIVSDNISEYRKQAGLSLQKLSEMTEVSKTMLNQIESGQSNPSITVLWKISNGLNIPLSNLITDNEEDIDIVDKSQIQPMYNDDKTTAIYPYFLYKKYRPFEMFQTELQPNSCLVTNSHHEESMIFLFITKGELKINIEGETYHLYEEQAIKFNSNLNHHYLNDSSKLSKFISLLHYID